MKVQREKHQYGYSFMNTMTGGQKVHTFWGYGTKEEAKVSADQQARDYARRYEDELNEKARRRNRSPYAPSHISVQIVGCSFWR